MPYPESCEYLWWLSVSVKLRTMTRGEVETIEEDDVGHLRISLLIVIGDLENERAKEAPPPTFSEGACSQRFMQGVGRRDAFQVRAS
jgi:hypothetical protein